jgi:predicted ATPase
MRHDLPSGTVTLVFTDVEGSTRLLHELGADAYAGALAEHRRVIRKACVEAGGVEVDTQGDAFFFAFPTAPGALGAASSFTDALAAGPIHVRVGLHTGTPLLTEEGYVGDDVHFAARIGSSGHGGQVVVSSATADLVEVELTDLGEHQLKDIDDPVPLYQLGDGSFPPLKTISNTNLPRPASSFLGRETELREVLSRIEAGARLVTLTGPGGTGKTRLAIEAATTLVGSYRAGVFWVGLASLRDPALVTESVSQVLGAKDGLAEHVAERELLLLIDNLEQVIECAPELSELLTACPNLTLLVTSRELLRISGEVEYAVPPLAEQEAIDLFCARAQLERSQEIAELCARLDSLPLAVELAAARANALTPSQILERIAGRLHLLKGGRDADPRQRTLRATIEWSYELLTPDEQELFARLSVFAGGCTLEAAEEVCDADLDTLQSLVEKSLVRFTPSETGGRYWMLETIREYAGDVLANSSDPDRHATRFEKFFVRLAVRGNEGFVDAPREWIDRFESERENLRSSLAASLARRGLDTAFELAIAYARLSVYRGPQGEGRRWLDAVLDHRVGVSAVHVQKALSAAAGLAERQKDVDVARDFAVESLALARTIDDPEVVGAALLSLGVIEGDAGNFDRSEELQTEALRVFTAAGADRQVRQTLSMLAFLYLAQADYARAIEVSRAALERSRGAGDERGVAAAASNLGHALAREGHVDEAVSLQREALRAVHGLRDVQGSCEVLLDFAALAITRGRCEDAATLVGAIEALAETAEFALVSAEVEWLDEIVGTARATLGDEAFAHVVGVGRLMTLDDVVEYALASID